MPVDDLLHSLQRRRVHIAIVLDEHGGTAGLVSIEDLIEEIVGEIQDEYDEEEPMIVPVGDDEARVDGRADVDELLEHFDTRLDGDDEEEFDTVGGLVYHYIGGVPKVGDQVVGRRPPLHRRGDRRPTRAHGPSWRRIVKPVGGRHARGGLTAGRRGQAPMAELASSRSRSSASPSARWSADELAHGLVAVGLGARARVGLRAAALEDGRASSTSTGRPGRRRARGWRAVARRPRRSPPAARR